VYDVQRGPKSGSLRLTIRKLKLFLPTALNHHQDRTVINRVTAKCYRSSANYAQPCGFL